MFKNIKGIFLNYMSKVFFTIYSYIYSFTVATLLLDFLKIPHLKKEIYTGDNIVKIDILCIPLVNYFNSIGLNTKFCCQRGGYSNEFYIQFEDNVNDEPIYNFILSINDSYTGEFKKWSRKNWENKNDIVSNWVYATANPISANYDLKIFSSFSIT